MNKTEFYHILKYNPTEWQIDQSLQAIRTKDKPCHCPITYVAKIVTGKDFSIGQFRTAAGWLGLTEKATTDIVCAADWVTQIVEPRPHIQMTKDQIQTVKRLKEVCGV